jgi:hypothetical protein
MATTDETEPRPPSYPDALGSFVDQSVRLAAAEREVARLRGMEQRIRRLAEQWQDSVTWDGSPAVVDRGFGARLMSEIEGETDVQTVRD